MTDDMYEHLVYDDFEFYYAGADRAPALRAHAHGERRVEGLLHDRLAHRLCRRAGAADQGDGDDPVAVDLEPDGGVAMGGGRGAQRAAGLHRQAQRDLQGAARPVRLDAQPGATASNARSRRARSTSIRPAPAPWARRRRPGKSSRPTRTSSPSLLEAEGVAVVQGTPFGFGPAFRISYATETERRGGGLPAHPAFLRQFEMS